MASPHVELSTLLPRAGWALRLALVEIGLTLAVTALVTWGGSSDRVSCASFPSCLAEQSTWVATAHQSLAGLLLIVSLAVVALAVPLRRSVSSPFLPSLVALVVLAITAVVGMLLAAGILPISLAPIQYGFLTGAVAAFVWTARNATRWITRAHRDARGPDALPR